MGYTQSRVHLSDTEHLPEGRGCWRGVQGGPWNRQRSEEAARGSGTDAGKTGPEFERHTFTFLFLLPVRLG